MNTLTIFDFTKNADLQNWYVVNDGVMGGKSAGKMYVDNEGHGLFKGSVSVDNNGGFTSIKYDAGKINLQGFSKFVIALKGDGKVFQFRLKTKSGDYFSYIFSFETTGNWQIIEILFNSMAASFRGQTLDMPTFQGYCIEEIGFLIGNKKAENFRLLIGNISAQ